MQRARPPDALHLRPGATAAHATVARDRRTRLPRATTSPRPPAWPPDGRPLPGHAVTLLGSVDAPAAQVKKPGRFRALLPGGEERSVPLNKLVLPEGAHVRLVRLTRPASWREANGRNGVVRGFELDRTNSSPGAPRGLYSVEVAGFGAPLRVHMHNVLLECGPAWWDGEAWR